MDRQVSSKEVSKLIDTVCNIFQRRQQTHDTIQANTYPFQELSSKAKACWRCPREEEFAQFFIQSLDPAPCVSVCLHSMGSAEQEAWCYLRRVPWPWNSSCYIQNCLFLSTSWSCSRAALLVLYCDSNGHGATKTVTLVVEEWVEGWSDCHHEDPVNKLPVLGFEANGKDVFRVLGKPQASSA